MKLIDKDTALKEIEKLIEEVNPIRNKVGVVGCSNVVKYLQKVLSLLNSLEVKEVDLEKEIDEQWNTDYEDFGIPIDDFYYIAKHFFELGMAVSNKAQKGENNG